MAANVLQCHGDVAKTRRTLDSLYEGRSLRGRGDSTLFAPTPAWRIVPLGPVTKKGISTTVQNINVRGTLYGAKGLTKLKDGGSIILNGSGRVLKARAFGVYAGVRPPQTISAEPWTTD